MQACRRGGVMAGVEGKGRAALYLQMSDDVRALDAITVESFGPLDEHGLGEALLLQGKGEGEAQGQDLVLQLPVMHEVGQTPGSRAATSQVPTASGNELSNYSSSSWLSTLLRAPGSELSTYSSSS